MLPPDEVASRINVDRPENGVPLSDERRRWLRGALAAGPVLMTVASRPVLGQTNCVAAYVATSMGPSHKVAATTYCSGLTPAQWKAHASEWPLPYCGSVHKSLGGYASTLYHCTTTGLGGRTFGDRTMLEVLDIQEGGVGIGGLGRYIVAALLNACSGRTPVLKEAGVRAMWNDTISVGYYAPNPGIQWSPPEIIAYLKTTMG